MLYYRSVQCRPIIPPHIGGLILIAFSLLHLKEVAILLLIWSFLACCVLAIDFTAVGVWRRKSITESVVNSHTQSAPSLQILHKDCINVAADFTFSLRANQPCGSHIDLDAKSALCEHTFRHWLHADFPHWNFQHRNVWFAHPALKYGCRFYFYFTRISSILLLLNHILPTQHITWHVTSFFLFPHHGFEIRSRKKSVL